MLASSLAAAGLALDACGGSSGGADGGSDAADVSVVEPDASEATAADAGTDASLDSSLDAPGPDVDASVTETGADAVAEATLDAEAGPIQLADAFAGDCGVGSAGEPTDLSCAGLYVDWSSKSVDAKVVEYDPGLHLWSDGAIKTRWVYLPPGQTIDTSDMDEWTFPVGTKLFKEFKLATGDGGTATRVETRMLWKRGPGSWYRTTYRWSADGQTSAAEDIDGALDAGVMGYEIPSQAECDACHNGRRDGVLGFEAVSLASPGASGVTIQTLVSQGWLSAPPATSLAIPGDPVQSSALGYLHANCGTACHNGGGGSARNTGFFLRLDVATLSSVQSTPAWQTGWNVPTFEFMIPSATTYRLHACDTTTSCVYYRASHRTGLGGTASGVQMPPLDTHRTDDAGLATIAAWIDEGCDGGM